MTTKPYSIKMATRAGERYSSMQIIDNDARKMVAEYRLTRGRERADIQSMRRAIDKHIAKGCTLGSYQW